MIKCRLDRSKFGIQRVDRNLGFCNIEVIDDEDLIR